LSKEWQTKINSSNPFIFLPMPQRCSYCGLISEAAYGRGSYSWMQPTTIFLLYQPPNAGECQTPSVGSLVLPSKSQNSRNFSLLGFKFLESMRFLALTLKFIG